MHPPNVKEKLKAAFLAGGGSLRAIAEANGVSPDTAARWARTEGWREIRSEVHRDAVEMATKDLKSDIAAHNARIIAAWDRVLAVLEERLAGGLDLESVELLTRALERVQRGQRTALGADVQRDDGPRELVVTYESLADRLLREDAEAAAEGGQELTAAATCGQEVGGY